MPPDVSVIIVSWNGRRYLADCLGAIAAQEGPAIETILVDNASTDGTAEYVRTSFPWVRIVSLPENRGFAAGSNAGAREAGGLYLAFLNNDTIAEPGWCVALKGGIDLDAGFALTTSRIVYVHDPRILDSAGDGLLRSGGAFKRHHGALVDNATESQEVFGACGAACLMPKSLFNELKGFDEDFFASHEDVDLSYRARLLGFRCRYVANAVVRHHGSATLGRVSAWGVFQGQRNVEWMYVKNTPTALLIRTLPAHLIYNLAAAAHFARLGLFMTFLRAKAAALAGLPKMLRKRADVQRTRRVDAGAIAPQLEKRWLSIKTREKRFDVGLAADA